MQVVPEITGLVRGRRKEKGREHVLGQWQRKGSAGPHPKWLGGCWPLRFWRPEVTDNPGRWCSGVLFHPGRLADQFLNQQACDLMLASWSFACPESSCENRMSEVLVRMRLWPSLYASPLSVDLFLGGTQILLVWWTFNQGHSFQVLRPYSFRADSLLLRVLEGIMSLTYLVTHACPAVAARVAILASGVHIMNVIKLAVGGNLSRNLYEYAVCWFVCCSHPFKCQAASLPISIACLNQ